MSNAGEISGAAKRYASAVFDLAKESNALNDVSKDLTALTAMLSDSAELRMLVETPVLTRSDQANVMQALGDKSGFNALTANLLGVLAQNGRLNALTYVIAGFEQLLAEHKNEFTAEVVSAHPLSDGQISNLSQMLKTQLGKEINISASVDESLLGGLVVRVGSRMIDTSLKAKLATLQTAMIKA